MIQANYSVCLVQNHPDICGETENFGMQGSIKYSPFPLPESGEGHR
jgi:hypothetical protein